MRERLGGYVAGVAREENEDDEQDCCSRLSNAPDGGVT